MPHTMLRFSTVKARTGLSRSTIYLRIARGTFPAPVSLGGRADVTPCHRRRPLGSAGVALGVLQSANLRA